MRRPSPAIIGSLAVHGAVVALALFSWPQAKRDAPLRTIASVPVSIISEIEVAAAAADNPSEELVTEDAATAPIPQPEDVPPVPEPEPTPPPPAPRPVERTPTPRPAPPPPRLTPPPPPKARPTPPRTTPPRPAPRREEPTLDLDALAGERRPSPNTGRRAPTGQRGQGTASQAQGQTIDWVAQVRPYWSPACDIAGVPEMRVSITVTLDAGGRIVGEPRVHAPRSEPVWRATADGAMRALKAAAPIEVPRGYEGGTTTLNFRLDQFCRGR